MAISDQMKSKLPHIIVTTLFGLSIWLVIRGLIKYLCLWFLQLGYSPFSIPIIIGKPLNNPLYLEMFFSIIIFICMWLLSTRVKFYQEIKMRFVTFGIMIFGIFIQFVWNASVPIYETLIPYIVNHQDMVYIGNTQLEQSLFSNTPNLMLFLLSLPALFLCMVFAFVMKLCNEHWGDLVIFFKDFKYNVKVPYFVTLFMSEDKQRKVAKDIIEFFDEREADIIPLPDVALGPNKKTEAMVIQRGKDRTLNNLIIGAIGTGKTSALVLPIINQDLHHMTYMINNYKKYYTQEGYHSEDIKGRFLNGLSVIEPSKDLCDKTFQLVKAHGIPEEVVFYIDPTNPNTPSLNLFKGPTDKVAEMFTMVVSGIGESQEFFFEQSQRSHLKHHIYLLKEHDPSVEVGFEDLINMYNDAQLVAQMHIKLKERLATMGTLEEIEDRDQRNHLLILKGISDWFDMTYFPVDKGFGKNMQPDIIKEGPYRGQQRVEDKKSEHVVGLRNILNDIASNILMRRVLFGKSDFDFDKHLEYGGILLVNTAKGELSSLSDVLGKFALLSLQNAVFRRKPNDSPFHHILVDEFPDYINEDFGSFPAQSRKYKAIITVVAQTVSQLQRKYGPDFMTTLVATLRNKFVYGDGTQLDAEMFSSIFGEKVIFEESESDSEVSPLMEDPNKRTGKSYKKTERAVMTVSEMIFQDKFVAAVKLVEDNTPLPAQQVKANFVSKAEFKEANVKVDENAAEYWLKIRRESLNGTTIGATAPSTEQAFQDAELVMDDNDLNIALPEQSIQKPLGAVNYESLTNNTIDQSMFANPSVAYEDTPSIEPTINRMALAKEEVNSTVNSPRSKAEQMADLLMSGNIGEIQEIEDNTSHLSNEEPPTDNVNFEDIIYPTSAKTNETSESTTESIEVIDNQVEVEETADELIVEDAPLMISENNPFKDNLTSFIKPIGSKTESNAEGVRSVEDIVGLPQILSPQPSNEVSKEDTVISENEHELKKYNEGKKKAQREKIEKRSMNIKTKLDIPSHTNLETSESEEEIDLDKRDLKNSTRPASKNTQLNKFALYDDLFSMLDEKKED